MEYSDSRRRGLRGTQLFAFISRHDRVLLLPLYSKGIQVKKNILSSCKINPLKVNRMCGEEIPVQNLGLERVVDSENDVEYDKLYIILFT